ncbi:MAG: ROK family protein [Acidobacteria bacterium]|nr:ROK family protein [Acidobacteriota bacterium]
MPVLGVDMGGTKIAAGLVDDQARVLRGVTLPTLAQSGFEVSLGQLYEAIGQVLTADTRAIGICAPGPLDPRTGMILNPPNLPGWRNVPLAGLVSRKFGRECRIENDGNAITLAETLFGAARGYSAVFGATLGTGIGAGIVLNGSIYHGKNGWAAEGGHLTVDYRSQAVCNCGVRGCIEALASGPAIAARCGMTCEELAARSQAGDAHALAALDETCELLAAWLGSIVSLLDPDIIVIGGGVAHIGEPLFSRLRALVPGRTINQAAAATPIVPAQLSDNAGILGAASVVLGPALR